MYSRQYQGRTLNFEPSGGLLNSSLVMQDLETDSYWSIMTGDSIAGSLKGTALKELGAGVKVQWKDWVQQYPDTMVLSINGVEDIDRNAYDQYMESDRGFRGMKAADDRLETKEPVYTFHFDGTPYAVPFRAFVEGGVFQAGGRSIFLYRPEGVADYYSSVAFASETDSFERKEGKWRLSKSGVAFDSRKGDFLGADPSALNRLRGFDTFWYIWSRTYPETEVLGVK